MSTDTRADLEHAIAEHRATLRRLEAEARTEPAMVDAVRTRIDALLDEWATCSV